MPDRKKIRLGDREVDAVRVAWQNPHENFNTYLLEDGTTLKVKVVVTDVLRVEGAQDPEGKPVYVIKSQNVVVTE